MRILWPSFVNAARNTRCFERLKDHLDNIAEDFRDLCAPSARVGQCVPTHFASDPKLGGSLLHEEKPVNSIIRTTVLVAATVIATKGLAATGAQAADLTVGFVTSLSGPGASIGIPYGRGIAAAYEYASTVDGEKT